MHILITGGTGLIGSAILGDPAFADVEFTLLSRNRASARQRCGVDCHVVESLGELPADSKIDAVINLAGEQIVGKRWTRKRKQAIRQSRIDLTRELVSWMAQLSVPPGVLLSGSAIGYYGDPGDKEITESDSAGSDFGAALCLDWETEAVKAEQFGCRVCLLRTGLVLTAMGGMLKQMLLPFRLCLGSRIGNGKQWMSWIHLEDHVAIVHRLLKDQSASGPYNLVAPTPVTNKTFTATMAKALGRIAPFVAPAFVIRMALGEAADLLLGGQKVLPRAVEQSGYQFKYPTLAQALQEVVQN